MQSLSDAEKTILTVAEQLRSMQAQPGFKQLREIMGEYVKEGLRTMEGCISSDDRLRSNLQVRWQARKDFVNMIDTYLADVEERRKETLRAIAESNGMSPTEAFDFAQENNNG